VTSTPTKTDGRRELGERTRERLLDATRALLAERGEHTVTLRDITEAAGTNVAAVSYHFGSVAALRRATVEQVFEALIDGQIERMQALDDDATVEEIAAAWAQPVITTIRDAGCAEHAFLRIMVRVLSNPAPDLVDWVAATTARADAELLPRLRRALPGVSDEELRFRADSAAGIMNFLVSGGIRVDLRGKTEAELERLLVPVISGALSAGGAGVRP
jgi:AcrR family transcriptional regulator